MAGHISESTCSEIPPSAPVPGMINRIIRTIFGRADEKIPVKSFRNFINPFRSFKSLRPNRTVGKCLNLGNFTYHSTPDSLTNFTYTFSGSTLITHLSGNFIFGCKFGQKSGFVNSMSQRLFTINILSHLQRLRRNNSVCMVSRTYNDCIKLVTHLLKKNSVILVSLGIGKFIEFFFCIFPVNIAESDYVFTGKLRDNGSSSTPYSDADNIKFVGGSLGLCRILWFSGNIRHFCQ